MMLEELSDLFAYDAWANDHMLEACAYLPAEHLERDMGNSFPSIIATIGHIVGSEWIWLERWKGNSPGRTPEDWNLSTLDEIRQRWAETKEARQRYLAAIGEATLLSDLTYQNTRGDTFTSPLWKLMRHLVNHSTHHRGQVVTMLRQLGAAAPNTDLIRYFRES